MKSEYYSRHTSSNFWNHVRKALLPNLCGWSIGGVSSTQRLNVFSKLTRFVVSWKNIISSRVPSRGGFGGLNPHQNHLDPHFIWPWVEWTLCIDLSQAGSNFSYGILKSLVCWWPHSSSVMYNVIRKYNICSRIKCQLVTCAQHDPASTPERVGLLLQMKTK